MPRTSRRTAKSTSASGSGLHAISISDLHAELRRRQRQAMPLVRRRAKIAAKLARLDAELAALGQSIGGGIEPVRRGPGRPPGRRGPRAKNAVGLVPTMQKVLHGKTLGVSEAATAVLAAGYRTNSKNFRTVVNQTLLVNKDKFKKVGRGQYTAK